MRSVAWNNDCLVGEGEETVVDGGKEFADVASRKVGTADGTGEESVSG